MRIKAGYMLRKVVDIYVIIGIGEAAYNPSQVMSLNDTGAFLWQILENGAEKQELVDSLTHEFDVDAGTAAKDVDVFLNALRDKELIEG